MHFPDLPPTLLLCCSSRGQFGPGCRIKRSPPHPPRLLKSIYQLPSRPVHSSFSSHPFLIWLNQPTNFEIFSFFKRWKCVAAPAWLWNFPEVRIRKATESGLGSVWESLICSSLSVIPLELGSGPHLCYHLHLRLHSVQPTWSRPTYPSYLQSIICQHLLLLPIWSFNPSLRSNSLSPFCLWRYLFYW